MHSTLLMNSDLRASAAAQNCKQIKDNFRIPYSIETLGKKNRQKNFSFHRIREASKMYIPSPFTDSNIIRITSTPFNLLPLNLSAA